MTAMDSTIYLSPSRTSTFDHSVMTRSPITSPPSASPHYIKRSRILSCPQRPTVLERSPSDRSRFTAMSDSSFPMHIRRTSMLTETSFTASTAATSVDSHCYPMLESSPSSSASSIPSPICPSAQMGRRKNSSFSAANHFTLTQLEIDSHQHENPNGREEDFQIHLPQPAFIKSSSRNPLSSSTSSTLSSQQVHQKFSPPLSLSLTHSSPEPAGNQVFRHLLPACNLNLVPPPNHLEQVMKAEVMDSLGQTVKFEDLIDRDFKTLVIFIRHFRSGYSQRYIKRLSKIANGEFQDKQRNLCQYNQLSITSRSASTTVSNSLDGHQKEAKRLPDHWISANGVKVIVIGNGNHQLIESYRKILKCPFPIYTDLSKDLKLYQLLGMKKINDLKFQQAQPMAATSPPNSFSSGGCTPLTCFEEPLVRDSESRIAFLSQVIYNALRMPWKWPGNLQQLGGEVLFEPVRKEKKIKRKPIKYKLPGDGLARADSVRSNSTCATVATSSERIAPNDFGTLQRRPSCTIRGKKSFRGKQDMKNSIHDSLKEIEIQCKFIHQMTNFKDHFSIEELLMLSGIRLTSLIRPFFL